MAKLSAAYQGMKQAGHKMSGGMCEACGGECKYSGGGEVKGVHQSSMEIDRPLDRKEKKWAGESEAGHTLSLADTGAEHKFDAISKHKQMLGEIVAMKNPKLKGLADGGEVKPNYHLETKHRRQYDSQKSERGVNEPRNIGGMGKEKFGESQAGYSARGKSKEHLNQAKDEAHMVLSEIKSMPNPKLKGLADGGPVVLDPDKVAQWNSGFKHAEGGEIEGMGMDGDGDMDDMMMEACADELFSAMKSGNKKEFVESLKALIMSMKG